MEEHVGCSKNQDRWHAGVTGKTACKWILISLVYGMIVELFIGDKNLYLNKSDKKWKRRK